MIDWLQTFLSVSKMIGHLRPTASTKLKMAVPDFKVLITINKYTKNKVPNKIILLQNQGIQFQLPHFYFLYKFNFKKHDEINLKKNFMPGKEQNIAPLFGTLNSLSFFLSKFKILTFFYSAHKKIRFQGGNLLFAQMYF